MSFREPPPQFTGDIKDWSRRLVDYLIRVQQNAEGGELQAVNLRHRLDDRDKAVQDGVIMFDPNLGRPVYSAAGAWKDSGEAVHALTADNATNADNATTADSATTAATAAFAAEAGEAALADLAFEALSKRANRIINGNFSIWQRSTSSAFTGYNAADRWRMDRNGGSCTISQQTFAIDDILGNNSPAYFLRQDVSGQSLAANFSRIEQRIEGVKSYAGQTITVLGWAKRGSGSGNMAISAVQDFGTGGSPSADVEVTGDVVALTTAWEPFAVVLNIPSLGGKTIGTNNDDFLGLRIWASAGTDYPDADGLGIQTVQLDIWGIHILPGTHTAGQALLYQEKSVGNELQDCLRYFEAGDYYQVLPINNTSVIGSFYNPHQYSVRKRAIPSVTGTNTVGTFFAANLRVDSVGLGRSNVVANRINAGTYEADAEL